MRVTPLLGDRCETVGRRASNNAAEMRGAERGRVDPRGIPRRDPGALTARSSRRATQSEPAELRAEQLPDVGGEELWLRGWGAAEELPSHTGANAQLHEALTASSRSRWVRPSDGPAPPTREPAVSRDTAEVSSPDQLRHGCSEVEPQPLAAQRPLSLLEGRVLLGRQGELTANLRVLARLPAHQPRQALGAEAGSLPPRARAPRLRAP